MSGTAPAQACFVVGAGPGLGSAVARRFAAAGHPVGVVGRSSDPLQQLVGELAVTRPAAAAVGDVADVGALRAALDELTAALGPPGVLVFNAVTCTGGAPSALPPDRLLGDYAVNVVGALAAVQHVLPSLLEVGGTALLTGGGAALYPSPGSASLSLTKSGLRLLAQLLHEELTPQGVHVATVTIMGGIGSRPRFAPDEIARTYVELHRQPRDEWTSEVQYAD